MRSEQWKTYRTRFLVKAKQLSSNLSFTDHLGRQHSGRRGDYLVESCDGVITIAPRQIFEDIYVPMSFLKTPNSKLSRADCTGIPEALQEAAIEFETIESQRLPRPITGLRRLGPCDPSRTRRKSPQPVRSAGTPAQLGFL